MIRTLGTVMTSLRKRQKRLFSRSRKPMGFATFSRKRVCAIASLGGTAISRDRDHMAAIGAKGGKARKGWRKSRAQFRKEHPLP